MRDGLLPRERVQAIQEEISEFLLEQVIDLKGEYYCPVHLEESVKKKM
jgi:histidinol phosphatase-like enzyme